MAGTQKYESLSKCLPPNINSKEGMSISSDNYNIKF